MSGWPVVSLGDVAEVIAGQSPKGEFYNKTGVGTPFYQGKKDFGPRFVEPTSVWTSVSTRVALPGDILMSVRAPVGPVNLAVEECCIGRGLAAIRTFGPIDRDFLFYYFRSKRGSFAGTKGAVFDSINKAQIQQIEIPLPPLDEQKRIVAKLDEAQSNLERLTENHENQMVAISALGRSALDQQMAVGQSEPRFSGAESADTPVDSEPLAAATDWPKVRLGDVAQILNGRAYAKEELLESGRYRVLRVGNFFSNRSWYWSDLELAADKYCEPGDLLYAWSASFGPRIWEGDRTIFHYHIWNIKEDATAIDRRFLFWWLTWDVEKIKAAAGTGSTMMHVTKGSMESRVLALPPLIEQRNIVAKLDGLQREQDYYRKSLDQRRSLASALRDKILASTFSGDI